MPDAGLTPSEIDAQRFAASERAVAEVKGAIQGERAVRDAVVIERIDDWVNCERLHGGRLEFRLRAGSDHRSIFVDLPDANTSPTMLVTILREAAAFIEAAALDLTNKEPNATD